MALHPDAGGWPASSPPPLIFSKQVTEQDFSISVQVPIGTPSTEGGTLRVSGSFAYSPGSDGGDCEGDSAGIIIAQDLKIVPTARKRLFNGNPGDIIEIEIQHNAHDRGSFGDRYLDHDRHCNIDYLNDPEKVE
ncbi:MAG: hypothetical protein ACMUIG_01640 [Thermoplasmatota archaeon]